MSADKHLITTNPPHVLVVIDEDGDRSWMRYSVECPGVTDVCAEWLECRDCTRRAAADETFAEQLHDAGEAHGVDHTWWDGTWWTPGSDRCWVAGYSELSDAADGVPGADKPGRYPIAHAVEDSEYLILGPAAVPVGTPS